MPILLAVNNYYYLRGGAEVIFFAHNRLFNEMGWQVVPFAMKHKNNLGTPWNRYFVDDIEYGSSYGLWEKIRRAPKAIYSIEARHKLSKLLEEVEPSICHVHNIYHHISPSVLSLVHSRGFPVVMTLHDLKIACPAYNMLARDGVCERCKGGRIYNVLLQRCIKDSVPLSALVFAEAVIHGALDTYEKYVDRFIVPSRFYIDKFTEWGWSRDRFVHIPNFIELSSYVPSYKPGRPFVFLGRLSREKGLTTLIKATAQANVLLRIIGTGPEEEKLRALVEVLGAKVEFSGYLSGDALHKAVRAARAIVLPSEWYENAPVAVIEAYALGKPVIGADIGGIPELIQEGETGFKYRSGSIEDLAEVLSRAACMSDDQLYMMGRNARALVEAEYSQANYRNRVLNLYRDLGVLF